MRNVLVEGLVVAVIGAALALAANALSPRGLKLTRDYFPSTPVPPTATPGSTNPATGSPSPTNGPLLALAARLQARGLQLIDSNRVAELFRDPRRLQDAVVFIDARNPQHYQEGHVPGAYLFDHYYPETYLAMIVPLCQNAARIVVYCSGGECDDSEFAALLLRDSFQIPATNLLVYGGGFTEWTTNGWPVELGARNSGQFKNARLAPPTAPAPN